MVYSVWAGVVVMAGLPMNANMCVCVHVQYLWLQLARYCYIRHSVILPVLHQNGFALVLVHGRAE